MATWRASRKASVLLSILVTLFVLCLTGCDTLQSADSSPTGATPTPPPSAHHQVTVASTPKAASMAATPAPVAAVQSAEKPIVQKVPEPGQTPHVSVRVAEAKPAPSPARVKGAETLVALSTSQTRSSEAAAGSPKPAQASALNPGDTALSSEPQALFFKGPERPPPRASHKFLWLGLGLGVCAAAGGSLTWFRLKRNRQVAQALPAKKQADDDVELPREFKVKERRVFVEDEPVTTDKT